MPELRTVPDHYVWFRLEGTPPIKLTLMNTSTPLKGGSNIKGFQIKRTAGTYKYTLLAENNEGNDSKTVEVTVLGKDSMLLNFIHSFCFATVFITGNLCPFRFVNNTNLPKYNIGNSVSPLINK